MSYIAVLKKEMRVYLKTYYDDIVARRDKTKFPHHGIHVYQGWQGSGKTISMVKHAYDVKKVYPRAIATSNLFLEWLKPRRFGLSEAQQEVVNRSREGVDRSESLRANLRRVLENFDTEQEYLLFETEYELGILMNYLENGDSGIIDIVDEAHLYFNSVNSKDTKIDIFAFVSQLRKKHRLFVATSQIFMRMEKAVREQAVTIIGCKTYFGVLTVQRAYDATEVDQDRLGALVGHVKRRGWFIQTRELRNLYDTMQIVISTQTVFENLNSTTIQITKKNMKSLKT